MHKLIAFLLHRYTEFRVVAWANGKIAGIGTTTVYDLAKHEPKTASDIIERKKSKPFKLHKSSAQIRSEFEAKHNIKEQKHQKLVEEISNTGVL